MLLSKSTVVALGVQLSSVIVNGFVLHVTPNMPSLQIFLISKLLSPDAVRVRLNVTQMATKVVVHWTIVTGEALAGVPTPHTEVPPLAVSTMTMKFEM